MTNPQQLPPVPLSVDSTGVQNYLTILQGIITRMAGNSANCKTWCVSLVSAILVLIADKGKPNYVFIALIPTLLFGLLDAYYLAQERAFRNIYHQFVKKLIDDSATVKDLFLLIPINGFDIAKSLCKSLTSFAIYPFYLTLSLTLILARFFLLGNFVIK